MREKLLNRQFRRNTERSTDKHGIYRRERARHQAFPRFSKPSVDHNCKWNESIIWARLAKALAQMHSRVSTILMTQQLSVLNRVLSSVVDNVQFSTIIVSGNACNDSNYSEVTTKEVLYAFA